MKKEIQEHFAHDYSERLPYIESLEKLALFVEHKSKFINITAIRDYESIWYKHIFDSLIVTKIDDLDKSLQGGCSVIDIGTGGGFPGLPLATCYPSSKFMLNDSTSKKLKVVDEYVEQSGIKNTTTVWGRAEELSKLTRFQSSFDIVLARSVASLFKIVEICKPYVKKGGFIVLYKSVKEPELAQLYTCAQNNNLQVHTKYEYEILGDKRLIIVLRS